MFLTRACPAFFCDVRQFSTYFMLGWSTLTSRPFICRYCRSSIQEGTWERTEKAIQCGTTTSTTISKVYYFRQELNHITHNIYTPTYTASLTTRIRLFLCACADVVCSFEPSALKGFWYNMYAFVHQDYTIQWGWMTSWNCVCTVPNYAFNFVLKPLYRYLYIYSCLFGELAQKRTT